MDMRLWKTFNIQKREGIAYYNTQSEFETEQFALHLNRLICEEMTATGKDGVMFLCIGTDRSTGDSLGPLIGISCAAGVWRGPLSSVPWISRYMP